MFVRLRPIKALGLAAFAIVGSVGICTTAGNMATAADATPSSNFADYVASKLEDFSATMRVVSYDARACEKINRDFGVIYKVRGAIKVQYKEENRMRIDGYYGTSPITFITSGNHQYVNAPTLHIHTNMDVGRKPGQRKTLLDVGMVSSAYLASAEGEFKRAQLYDGVNCAVFQVSYRDKSLDTSHRLVWIDPVSKITLKREEYSQAGKLLTTYLYKAPKEVSPGVWFPSRIEVYNNEGEKAGVTSYNDVKVNQGIPDSVFQL